MKIPLSFLRGDNHNQSIPILRDSETAHLMPGNMSHDNVSCFMLTSDLNQSSDINKMSASIEI